MIPFDESLNIINSINISLKNENISVENATDRVSCDDVISCVDYPACDNSAMDGYAVNSDLTKEIKIFSKIKKETYLYVNKNNSAPITSTDETLSTYFDHLLKIKAFSESIIDFIKELFMKKELFEKYVKFDNNVRLIWPNIYKGFG